MSESQEPNSIESGELAAATTVTNGPAVAEPVVAPVESIIDEINRIEQIKEQEQLMANENFDADIVVIGSGPAGYVAAIRAAQLGASVIVVEKEYLGGTCLNWGCIPSKALIGSVERLHAVKDSAAFGVNVSGEVSYDFAKIMARKEKIVQTQRGGVGMLFKKNKIRHVEGFAKFVDAHTLSVTKGETTETIRAKNIILATGASAIHIPVPGLEGKREQNVWTSDDAVTAPFVPKSMLILGGGAVGVEFSYVFNGLGSDITLVEFMPTLLPIMEAELGTELEKNFKKQGIKVRTGTGLDRVERNGEGWRCYLKKGDQEEVVDVEVVLLGVGRKANVEGLGLEEIGVKLHKKGVEVDEYLRTAVPSVYAIGDVHGHIQLAHVGSHEGVLVVENLLLGKNKPVDYKAVPNAVYTHPEVAGVGLTEKEAKEQGYDVVTGKYGFMANGKAMASGETTGFVKVIAEKKYGEVLGVHMIGGHVTDLLAEAVVAIKLEATLDAMVDIIHAHPTMSEVVFEAFEDAAGHSIHKL